MLGPLSLEKHALRSHVKLDARFPLPYVPSLPLFAFRDLVAHKIPERFPKLRFGFIEASASWVPYVLHHLARSSGAKLNSGGDADAALEWGPKLFSDYRLYVAAEADEDLAYL